MHEHFSILLLSWSTAVYDKWNPLERGMVLGTRCMNQEKAAWMWGASTWETFLTVAGSLLTAQRFCNPVPCFCGWRQASHQPHPRHLPPLIPNAWYPNAHSRQSGRSACVIALHQSHNPHSWQGWGRQRLVCQSIREIDWLIDVISCFFKGYARKAACVCQGKLNAVYGNPKGLFPAHSLPYSPSVKMRTGPGQSFKGHGSFHQGGLPILWSFRFLCRTL